MTGPVLSVLRTARDYHQPPSAWLGGDGAWSAQDRTITLALTMYEAGLCAECGQHMSICRDPAASFEIVEDTCQAKAEVDQHQQANSKNEPEPGQVISARLDNTPSVARPPWEQN